MIEEKNKEEDKSQENKEKIEEKETVQKEGAEKKDEEKVESEKPVASNEKTNEKTGDSASAKTATDDEEKEIEIPKKFQPLVEQIEKMSVLDLAELVKILEKKFGVSAAVQVAAAPAGQTPGGEAAPAEEKSVFKIELKSVGDKKIEVIKAVRDIMGKGLKEAKDLVDAVANGPQVIKENAKKEEAEDIKKKFEAAGATIELK